MLALVVLIPRFSGDPSLIGPVAVQVLQLTDDGTRTGQISAPMAGQLRTGQAFVLTLSPGTEGWLVVYHVGPDGSYSLVFSGETPPAGSDGVTIPTAASGDFWVLDGEPGPESFVIGASEDVMADQAALEDELGRVHTTVDGHAAVVSVLAEALAEAMTEVQVLNLTHID